MAYNVVVGNPELFVLQGLDVSPFLPSSPGPKPASWVHAKLTSSLARVTALRVFGNSCLVPLAQSFSLPHLHSALFAWDFFPSSQLVKRACSVMSDSFRSLPLSMEFSRQEYCSRVSFPSPGDFPDPGSNLSLLHCRWGSLPANTGRPQLVKNQPWRSSSTYPVWDPLKAGSAAGREAGHGVGRLPVYWEPGEVTVSGVTCPYGCYQAITKEATQAIAFRAALATAGHVLLAGTHTL